jgi:hypothetical protein
MNLVSIETAQEQLLVASGLTKLEGNSPNPSLIVSQWTSDSFQQKARGSGGLPDQIPAKTFGLGRLLDET